MIDAVDIAFLIVCLTWSHLAAYALGRLSESFR